MNYEKHLPGFQAWAALIFMATSLFYSCQGELPDVPAKEEFTKKKLEQLGSMMQTRLLETYNFLPQVSPYDTSVYWYVQTLYNQATNVMHRDMQSAPDNRWDKDRLWRVFIIDDDDLKHAFVLPGGDLYISTGMLLSFKKEYELYYLLSFEALMMHEGFLLNRLILEYNSLTLNNIIEGNEGANQVTADLIADALPMLVYEKSITEELDRHTLNSVCETSILDPTGISPFLLSPGSETSRWLATRPSYNERVNLLSSMLEGRTDCGDKKGTGNYQRFVLNVLE